MLGAVVTLLVVLWTLLAPGQSVGAASAGAAGAGGASQRQVSGLRLATSAPARVQVSAPGRLAITSVGLTGHALTTGSDFGVRIGVRSDAAAPADLIVAAAPAGPLVGGRREVAVPAGGERVFTLTFRSHPGTAAGVYPLTLRLHAADPGFAVNVAAIRVSVAVLSPQQLLLDRAGPFIRVARELLPPLAVLIVLAVAADITWVRTRTRLGGRLEVRPRQGGSRLPGEALHLDLRRYHAREIWAAGQEGGEAQLRLPFEPASGRAFRVYCEFERPTNWWLGALRALVARPHVRVMIETVSPHHLYLDGLPCTRARIYHQDAFEVGGVRFIYLDPSQPSRPAQGTDLLARAATAAEPCAEGVQAQQ